MQPSISIIIPVYKTRNYIEQCLSSIIEQDYPGDIECILVDDCGPDDSIEVAKRFIAEHQESKVRFEVLYHDRNRTQSAARNTGMRKATGEYIFFVDSDDWIDRNALSLMVETLAAHPDCDMVQAGSICSEANTCPWLMSSHWKEPTLDYTDDRQWIVECCAVRFGMIPMTPYSKLMRRSFLEEFGFAFAEGHYHEDEIWLVRLAKYLRSVAFCHHDVYHYIVHTDSTTNGGQNTRWNDLKWMWLEIMKLLDDDFRPRCILKQIDFDTSDFYLNRTQTPAQRRMLASVKLHLMRHCQPRTRLRLLKWIIFHAKGLIF